MSHLMRFEKSARFAWRASASPMLPTRHSPFAHERASMARSPPQRFALADPLSHRSTPPFRVSTHRGKQPHRRRRAGAGGSGRIRRSDDWPVGFGVFCGNAARHAENTRDRAAGRPHQGLHGFRRDRDRGDRHHAGLGGAGGLAGFARTARLRVLGNLRGLSASPFRSPTIGPRRSTLWSLAVDARSIGRRRRLNPWRP